MFPLFESIRIENGVPENLTLHIARMHQSCLQVIGKDLTFDPSRIIKTPPVKGVLKCRLEYNHTDFTTKFESYHPRQIQSLRLVNADDISYAHKFTDRQKLQQLFDSRGDFDDILIVKNNLITDTSIGNILLFRSKQWVTPANPLLKGTMRQLLLESNQIKEEEITVNDLRKFKLFRPINAMVGLTLHPQPVSRISR